MKRRVQQSLAFILAVTLAISVFIIEPFTANADDAIDIKAESAILVDVETGKIIYAKNPDIALPPASMTKMMTEYLVWEAIESGEISWDTTTQISDYPYSISANDTFSGVGLRQNVDYTVKSLYEAMAINSDNATTIALAELIAGSEGEFVKMMNDKAKEMGLEDYKFVNSTGLENSSLGDNYPKGTEPNDTNLLSARASALLAYHLVNDFPESLSISNVPELKFDEQTIRNWNWMLPHEASFLKQYHYEGVDGLKTGFTELAGYCFTATAEKDGQRLISVVMKTSSEDARFKETAKLLDYGFTKFESNELFEAGYQVEDQATIPVTKGKGKSVNIGTKEAITVPIRKGEEDKYSIEFHIDKDNLNEDGKLEAPIKKGDVVGSAELVAEGGDYGYIDSKANKKFDVIATEDVKRSNWFMITLGAIGGFFSNMFSSVVDIVKGWIS